MIQVNLSTLLFPITSLLPTIISPTPNYTVDLFWIIGMRGEKERGCEWEEGEYTINTALNTCFTISGAGFYSWLLLILCCPGTVTLSTCLCLCISKTGADAPVCAQAQVHARTHVHAQAHCATSPSPPPLPKVREFSGLDCDGQNFSRDRYCLPLNPSRILYRPFAAFSISWVAFSFSCLSTSSPPDGRRERLPWDCPRDDKRLLSLKVYKANLALSWPSTFWFAGFSKSALGFAMSSNRVVGRR